jgi:hypothetical protein
MQEKSSMRESMHQRAAVSVGAVVAVVAVVLSVAVSMPGQSPASGTKATPAKSTAKAPAAKSPVASKAAPAPRTAWGEPDLQGTWFVMEGIPVERSPANAGKEFLTDEEIAASDKQKGIDPGRNARAADSAQDVNGAYNAVFNSVLKTGRRTSLIIDPPDGRIPPLVEGAQGRGGRGGGGGGRGAGGGGAAGAGAARGAGAANGAGAARGAGAGGGGAARGGGGGRGVPGIGPGANDNPETLAQNPRCLGVQTPFMPENTLFAQGTVFQIVQSPKSLGLYMEDDHAGGGNRVVYIDGRPHLPPDIKLFLGDSRGHWEGNTLVIETTNFQQAYRGANPDRFKMTERLTRLDANTLRRDITFEDPTTWTKPWTVRIEMGRAPSDRHMIFDSACHEGNYAITGMLVGARREEEKAAQK